MSDMRDGGLDTARLRALAEHATPGPWETRPYDLRQWTIGKCLGTDENLGNGHPIRGVAVCDRPPSGYTWITTACEKNAEFIAAAREAVPALLAEIERLTRERDALNKPMQQHCASCVDAQCWGTRQPLQAEVESLQARVAALEAENATIKAALRALCIDANRLCDRQLGGSYEDDCRATIAVARKFV